MAPCIKYGKGVDSQKTFLTYPMASTRCSYRPISLFLGALQYNLTARSFENIYRRIRNKMQPEYALTFLIKERHLQIKIYF